MEVSTIGGPLQGDDGNTINLDMEKKSTRKWSFVFFMSPFFDP